MVAEFVAYKQAPGFWFYIAMVIGSDLSDNPRLSAKYTPDEKYLFDINEIFEEGMKRYLDMEKWRKARY